MSEFIEVDGVQYHLGNNPNPKGPVTLLGEYPTKDLLTKEQIAKIITAKTRVRSRDRGWDFRLNQGARSSCNPYAIVAAAMKKRFWMGWGQLLLSPEFVYAHINGDRDQGSMLDDGMAHMLNIGTCPFDMVPYQAYQMKDISIEAKRIAPNYRGFEWYALPRDTLKDVEIGIGTALARDEPVVLAVHVDNRNFMKLDGNEVVMPTNGPGNHAIHCDDIRINGQGEFEFDHCGSWGKQVHKDGRGYLTTKKHLAESYRYHAFFALRSMQSDPNAPSPIEKRLAS